MQAADLGDRHDGTDRRRLNGPRDRGIPLQGEMRPGLVVVADVSAEDLSELILAEDDQVVQALPAYRPDDFLGVWVLPGGLRGSDDLLDAQPRDPVTEPIAVDGVPIMEQIAHAAVGWLVTLVMGENPEAEEQPEGSRGDDEEIAGCRGAKVIPKKGTPGLCDGGLLPRRVMYLATVASATL